MSSSQKPPCRESELDALLAGELSAEAAERVRAHAAACATCTRSLAWQKLERGWMAQRARRMPSSLRSRRSRRVSSPSLMTSPLVRGSLRLAMP